MKSLYAWLHLLVHQTLTTDVHSSSHLHVVELNFSTNNEYQLIWAAISLSYSRFPKKLFLRAACPFWFGLCIRVSDWLIVMGPKNKWGKQNFLDSLGRAVTSKSEIRTRWFSSFRNHPYHTAVTILQTKTAGWTSTLASTIISLPSSQNNWRISTLLCFADTQVQYVFCSMAIGVVEQHQ